MAKDLTAYLWWNDLRSLCGKGERPVNAPWDRETKVEALKEIARIFELEEMLLSR